MLVLPIPVFVALVLGFLLLRRLVAEGRLGPLSWPLALCAAQSLIIALAQHYQIPGMRLVQPVTATLIPPAAWLAFQASAVRRVNRRDLAHLAGPVAALASLVAAPALLDLLIPLLFLGYGAAILRRCLGGPDALPQLRLEAGAAPARIWIVIATALGLSALTDALIFVAMAAGAPEARLWLVSLVSAGNLLVVGGLSIARSLDGAPAETQAAPAPDDKADAESMAALARLMEAERPYLDPDLTLIKLARKLGVSAKALSAAINRTTGENVSRYINAARIDHAKARLAAGDSVTAAMLASGFNTKSNFNREFLRITGKTPTEWAQARAASLP
jgi:AraC-like DNA-binding protein